MMIVKNKLKEGDIVWACAFDIDLDRNTGRSDKVVHSRCKPVKGVIHNNHFHELKKSGTPKGSSVSLWARDFADTYEECVEIYNRKIGEKINKLCGVVKELRKELIEMERGSYEDNIKGNL